MSTFLLVHGAMHGAWCWYKIIPRLENAGHCVLAPDLPGLGMDRTPVHTITLGSYVDRICEILDAQEEPVILVGHSMGGAVISQAAEYRPEKVRLLVYVAAFLLQPAQSLLHVAARDKETQVLRNLYYSKDKVCTLFKPEALKEALYEDCSDEDLALARSLIGPQPVAPSSEPLSLTHDHFGSVPKVYVECLRDKAITPRVQQKMYTATPCKTVLTMDSSHSPFFSKPDELADKLLDLAK